jgi:hypothetical protein
MEYSLSISMSRREFWSGREKKKNNNLMFTRVKVIFSYIKGYYGKPNIS